MTENYSNISGEQFVEAVISRRSVRTYNGLRPDSAKMGRLREMARMCTTLRDGDPIFAVTGSGPEIIVSEGKTQAGGEKLGAYGMVKGARCFAVGACGPGDYDQLALGFCLERFIVMCTAAGLGSCWLGATFTHGRFQRYYDSHCSAEGKGLEVKAVSPLGHQAPKARWGERIVRWMAKSDSRKPFGELFSGVQAPPAAMPEQVARGEIDLRDMSARKLVALGLEMTRLAPSSSNSQPWRGEVNEKAGAITVTLRSTAGAMGGFLMLDMGIALFHFTETLRLGGRPYSCTISKTGKSVSMNIDITC